MFVRGDREKYSEALSETEIDKKTGRERERERFSLCRYWVCPKTEGKVNLR